MISIAEIHPMLVHFPIVLWLSAEVIAVIVLINSGNLSNRGQWPLTAFVALLVGTVFAILAAVFGDIALDHAVSAGYSIAPIETHETFALITICIFALHTLLRFLAFWRKYPLTGFRGWISELPGIIGIPFLLVTAYFGGHLVYRLGINVIAVIH